MKSTHDHHRRAVLGLPIYGPYSRNLRRSTGRMPHLHGGAFLLALACWALVFAIAWGISHAVASLHLILHP